MPVYCQLDQKIFNMKIELFYCLFHYCSLLHHIAYKILLEQFANGAQNKFLCTTLRVTRNFPHLWWRLNKIYMQDIFCCLFSPTCKPKSLAFLVEISQVSNRRILNCPKRLKWAQKGRRCLEMCQPLCFWMPPLTFTQ